MSSLTESHLRSDFNNANDLNDQKKRVGCCARVRHIVAGLVVLATFNVYLCRINLSEAIVAMSKIKKSKDGGANTSDVCFAPVFQSYNHTVSSISQSDNQTHSENSLRGEFDWDEKTQGVILGAFFYGYIMFQVVGGRLAEIFGAKWLCGGGIAVSIVINALTPLIAKANMYWLLLASRVVLGAFQAGIFPSCYALFSKWAPDHERSTVLALPTIGGNIGSIATSALSGYLSEHGFAGGWPSVFYVSAAIASVWLIVWTIFVESEPKHHRWISHEEIKYIESNIASNSNIKRSVPWLKIFTSMPVIAAIVVKFTINWTYILYLLKLPAYLQSVFNVTVTQNGAITSLVYLVLTISLFVAGYLADVFVRKEFLHKTKIRKIFQCFSTIGSALCLAAIPLAGCNKTVVIALLMIGMILFGMNAGGDIPVVADMTNNFSATVFGVANTVAFTCGFITPLVVGLIVESSHHTKRNWGYVFYMTAAINIFGGIFFLIFGSAERQHWDKDEEEAIEKKPQYISRI